MAELLDLKAGTRALVSWEPNSRCPGTVKANAINGQKVKKIILPSPSYRGQKLQAGQTWVCTIEKITNPKSNCHGAIIVLPQTLEVRGTFEDVWVEENTARQMAIVLQNREKNLMLEGDQGTGKSTIAAAIARSLGWEFRKVSGGQIKKYNAMYGRFIPSVTEGANGVKVPTLVWEDSRFAAVLREANRKRECEFLLMIDEYTRMDEDARDALLDVIEGAERFLSLSTGETITVSPNVHFMAAGNVGDGFTIRREDAAAKDRWVILKVCYMPQDVEVAHCLSKYTGCPKADLERGIAIANLLRQKRNDTAMRLSKAVSTRAVQNMAMLLQGGVPLADALKTAFVNQFSGNAADTNTEAGRVWKLVQDSLNNGTKTQSKG